MSAAARLSVPRLDAHQPADRDVRETIFEETLDWEMTIMTTMTFHRLHQMIDDEARRAAVELLDAMQDDLRFELGTDLHVASDDVTVFVRCVRTDSQRYYYADVVLAGVPAGREVADIPWSLRSSTGREIGRV